MIFHVTVLLISFAVFGDALLRYYKPYLLLAEQGKKRQNVRWKKEMLNASFLIHFQHQFLTIINISSGYP